MKKICFCLCFFVLTLFGWQGGASAEQEEIRQPENLYARSAVLMDGSSGRVLFEKNGSEVMPMASTTKIMTCILALENSDLREKVTVSANAAAQPKVHLGMQTGEEFYLEDLLYSLMLESHNDSAVAIAEQVGGSVEGFAAMMNEKAEQLGCSHTHFVTPNGLDAQDAGGAHGTTASELAKIMSYCVSVSPKREDFLKITQTRSKSFTNVDKSRSFSCQNHNAFLDMMEGVISGKTGFTSAAGYCYVGALESGDRTFVVALLACGWPNNRGYKWKDASRLMEYGLEYYKNEEITCSLKTKEIPVQNGLSEDGDPWKEVMASIAPQTAGNGRKKQYLLREDEKIKSHVILKKTLMAPVEKGTVVGSIKYYLGEQLLEEYPIITTESVERKYLEHCLAWVMKRFAL